MDNLISCDSLRDKQGLQGFSTQKSNRGCLVTSPMCVATILEDEKQNKRNVHSTSGVFLVPTDVMYSPTVCLFVSSISRKVLDDFVRNLVDGFGV